jgi:hypothetical protein
MMEGQGTGISKHLDDLLMGEVLDEKNTFGALREIMGEIHKLANNTERKETTFCGLHYLHQTLLESVQRENKGPAGTGGMDSLSDATSGDKHNNRRKKRASNRIRDEKRGKKLTNR